MSDFEGEAPTNKSDGRMAIVIYVLYLLVLIVGITPLVGVIMAYVLRGDNPPWVESHYRFQIVTFCFGLVALVITLVLIEIIEILAGLFGIGAILWWIIRNVRGLALAVKGKAIPDPESWKLGVG